MQRNIAQQGSLPPDEPQLRPGTAAANNIRVIKDTHGKTSHLSARDIEALSAYLLSLQR